MTKKYRSFTATISLPTDFIGDIQDYVFKWLSKQDYAYGVIEHDKSGKRHAHFQTWSYQASAPGDLFKQLKLKIAKLHPDAVLHHAFYQHWAYNDDYLTYCDKDKVDDKKFHEMIIDNAPPGDTTEFYPSEEEQAKVQEQANAVDKKFHKWRTDFIQWWSIREASILSENGEPTLIEVASFLSDMMFKSKKYPVIVDKKNRVQNCKSLYMYICNKIDASEFVTEEIYSDYLLKLEAKMS